MIVFVKVSARRYLALSVATFAPGWRSTLYHAADEANLGYEYQYAEIIAGPSDWTTVEVAAREYATAHNELMPHGVHEEKQKRETARVEAANAALGDRNVPAGYKR
jgi:hypothetical protein